MSTKVNKGLYAINSGELPIGVNNICRWLAYEKYSRELFNKATKKIEEYDGKPTWYRLTHGRPGYPPAFMLDNPFPQPSSEDLDKFEREYPDMAKEWK